MKARSLVLAIISGIFFWFQLVLVNPLMVGCAAGENSFVLKPDGTLWAWGANIRVNWEMGQR